MTNINITKQCSITACIEQAGTLSLPQAAQNDPVDTYQECGCDNALFFGLGNILFFGRPTKNGGPKEPWQTHLENSAILAASGDHLRAAEEAMMSVRSLHEGPGFKKADNFLAVQILKKAEESFTEAGEPDKAITALNLALTYLENTGAPEQRLFIYKRLAEAYNAKGDHIEEAEAFTKQGHVLKELGRLPEAVEAFKGAYELISAEKFSPLTMIPLHHASQQAAYTLMDMGDYRAAIDFCSKADEPDITPVAMQASSVEDWLNAHKNSIVLGMGRAEKAQLIGNILAVLAIENKDWRTKTFGTTDFEKAYKGYLTMAVLQHPLPERGPDESWDSFHGRLQKRVAELTVYHQALFGNKPIDFDSPLPPRWNSNITEMNIKGISINLKQVGSALNDFLSARPALKEKFKTLSTMWLSIKGVRDALKASDILRCRPEITLKVKGLRETVAKELGIEGRITAKALLESGIRMGAVERPAPPDRAQLEVTARACKERIKRRDAKRVK